MTSFQVPSRNEAPRPNSGLGVLELLVIVFLIGVLSAVAQPYVGSIREDARRVQCQENLRQIAWGVLQYENEHGMLPGPIFRRVRRPEGAEDLRELNWIMDDYFGPRAAVWDCPSNTLLTDESSNPGGVVFVLNNRATATNPPRFFGYPATLPPPKSLQQIIAAGMNPVGRVMRDLNQIWMISCADGLNYNAVTLGPAGGFPIADGVPPVHDGGRNYAFFSGHVEHRLQGNFPP